MVVAESRGLLKPLTPRDSIGRLREKWLLGQIDRELSLDFLKLKFQRDIRGMQYMMGDSEAELFKHHHKQSQDTLMSVLSVLRPGVDWAELQRQAEEKEKKLALDRWEATFGSLDDPEVQEDMDKLIKWLEEGETE